MIICKCCGSPNVSVNTSSYNKSQNRSCLWNIFMLCITGGLWLIWMLVRADKEKNVVETYATCNNCGYRWKV